MRTRRSGIFWHAGPGKERRLAVLLVAVVASIGGVASTDPARVDGCVCEWQAPEVVVLGVLDSSTPTSSIKVTRVLDGPGAGLVADGDLVPLWEFSFVPQGEREHLVYVRARADGGAGLEAYHVVPMNPDGEVACSTAREGSIPLDVAVRAALAPDLECSEIVAEGADLKPFRGGEGCTPWG